LFSVEQVVHVSTQIAQAVMQLSIALFFIF
jgi:hypothetical protein